MVKIRCFRGYLAKKDECDKVIAPAYEKMPAEEARQTAEENPMSFLNVNKIEAELAADQIPHTPVAVQHVAQDALPHFITEGWLVQDDLATMYIYQQTRGTHVQQGILALTSVQDYENQRIKRHESTLSQKERDLTILTNVQSANTSPVFLTFKDN